MRPIRLKIAGWEDRNSTQDHVFVMFRFTLLHVQLVSSYALERARLNTSALVLVFLGVRLAGLFGESVYTNNLAKMQRILLNDSFLLLSERHCDVFIAHLVYDEVTVVITWLISKTITSRLWLPMNVKLSL